MRPCFYEIEISEEIHLQCLSGLAFLEYASAKLISPATKLRRVFLGRDPVLDGIYEYKNGMWEHIGLPRIIDHETCGYRVDPETPRRPVNGLNIECGSPSARCLMRPPGGWMDGRSNLAWILSGGSILDYGHCKSTCPKEALIIVLEEV